MKIIITFTISTLLFIWQNTYGQGFVNLNFESAVITPDSSSPYYPNAIYSSNAIPGWTATGFIGPDDILYNSASVGSGSVSILGTNGFPPALDGAYSIYLYGGHSTDSASISQTAIVPAFTKSIFFEAQGLGAPLDTLLLSLGGQDITFFALSTESDYTLYGGDVSAFAGKSEQLSFSALAGENFWNIDDIQFSSSPVPEPSVFDLTALGSLFLVWRRWKK